MKNPAAPSAPVPAPAAVGTSLAKRLARFRKRIKRMWNGVESFREQYPRELRRAGDLAAAERECARAIALHPDDLPLAIEHAEIAKASKDLPARISRWQHVLDLGGDRAPAEAFSDLAECLRDEGLLAKAEAVLRKGLAKYPDSALLQESLADLNYALAAPSRNPGPCEPVHPATAHLFQDRYEPTLQGTVAFTPGRIALRQHVPAMLGFAKIVPAPKIAGPPGTADVFGIWGEPRDALLPVRETAAAAGKPLLCLDSGFLSSPGIEGEEAPVHSIVVTPDAVYYDSTRPSHLGNLLNSDAFTLSEKQLARAESCITSIVGKRLSKFNHAPRIDLRRRFPADGTRRLLLIDQRKGGPSIHWSLGGQATFERMLETALAQPNRQILVKIHPEAIAGRAASQLAPLLPDPLPQNVVVIDYDVNPHDLLDIADEIFVCTSQLGFEAVLAGKHVHCFAAPYYAGWGFTRDELAIPRRKRRRTPAEVFHLYHIVHSRYFVPEKGVAEIEDLIDFLAAANPNAELVTPALDAVTVEPISAPDPLKILIIIPNERYGPTGRYSQDIGVALTRLGCQVMVICEGSCTELDAGVHWRTLTFDGIRLAAQLRTEITAFAPHFIYENGVRSRAQRAALEAVALTGAHFALHSADDDVQVQISRHGPEAAESLVALDRPELSTAEIEKFLREHDWKHSLHVALDPEFDRWVEPILRVLCYRMASFHTAIWHPFEDRLAREYGVPTLIVPPVASPADFARIPLTAEERELVLQRYGIERERTVIFINGSLYSYSPEYALFLDALNLAAADHAGDFALVVISSRTTLPLARMARERLDERISFTDLGVADDGIYMEMLRACDVVCSPGLPDTFNRYRLPSRLVKAMAMGKPILTCRCGFGESLEHGENAFLMDGEDPADWAAAISLTRETTCRVQAGMRGREFAANHFDAALVAEALKNQFELALREPPRALAAGIRISPAEDGRARPKIRLRSRHHSPRQPAIHALALRTHRLDTVVHIGVGGCDELEDYCRLGARRIALPVGDAFEAIGNFAGTLSAMDFEIAVPPGGSSCRHLLVIEEDGTGFFQIIPVEVLKRFRWVVSPKSDAVLAAAGFHEVRLRVDHSGQSRHLLFEQTSTTPSPI